MFNPRVLESLENAIFSFCDTTLDTAITDAETAYGALRRQLKEGLSEGETNRELARRVQGIFGDQQRAGRIAITEASRAMHGGQLMLDRETGIVGGKKWLASSDACQACLAMAAKGTVDLEEPFFVHPKGNPAYRVVMYPPLHPHCFCSYTSVVDYAAVESGRANLDILRVSPGTPRVAGDLASGVQLAAHYVPSWTK